MNNTTRRRAIHSYPRRSRNSPSAVPGEALVGLSGRVGIDMALEGVGERVAAATAPLTPRGRSLVFAAAALAVAGFFQPVSATRTLLVAVSAFLFSLIIVSRIMFSSRLAATARLVVERRLEGNAVEGGEARVVVIVRNNTPLVLERLEVYDTPPPLVSVAEGAQPVKAVVLPAYSSTRLEYPVRLVVGKHSWGPVRLVLSDWLGLYRGEVVVEEPFTVEVKPRPLPVPRRGLAVAAPYTPSGLSRAQRRGAGVVFYSLREYMPDDDARLVDWKAYARHRRLFVKEYERETVLYSVVLVDVTPTLGRGVVGETKIEYSARIAASLSLYFSTRGDYYRVALLQPSGELEATPWLRGRKSSLEAIRLLGSIEWPEPGSSAGPERAEKLRRALLHLVSREKTIVILVSDFSESRAVAEAYADILSKLAMLRHEVVAVMPLTTLFELRALREGREAALYQLLSYERISAYREIARVVRRKAVPLIAAGPLDLASNLMAKLEAYRGVVA